MKTALNEDSTNGWNAQSNPFMLVKQFRKMRAVAAGITFPVKLLHPLLQFIGQGMTWLLPAILVGKSLSTSLTIFGLQPISLAGTDA